MLKEIPIGNITCLKNYRTIDVDNGEYADLVASIKKDGVLQAGLVRPNKKKPGHYELIFGNRRFLASKEAGCKNYPATIKDVADDDVLEFQIMENLQRKDVHPMDEAAGFKAYKAKKNCDIKELAAVFAKSERYITNRLALNTLNDDLQKDFLKGMLSIVQAEIFAKLATDQQKSLKSTSYDGYRKTYSSAASLKNTIDNTFLLKLDSAPWKKDDENLLPVAGSCNDCKKRSSCNALLFADIATDDRCLDASCYKLKDKAFFLSEVEKIATTKPDIKFFATYGDIDNPVKSIAHKYGIPILHHSDNGVSDYKGSGGNAVKCFTVNGNSKGKYVTVYVRNNSKGATKATKGQTTAEAIKEQTTAIQQRLTRGKELDYEKVHELVVKTIVEQFPKDNPLTTAIEKTFFDSLALYLVFKEIDYTGRDLLKAIGLEDKYSYRQNPETLFKKLDALDDIAKSAILKTAVMVKCSSERSLGTDTFIIRQLAVYLGIPVQQFIADQEVIAAKREGNATKKIDALKATAKPVVELKPKPAVAADKKTPAPVKKITPVKKKDVKPAKKVAKKSSVKKSKKKAA